MKPTKKCPCCHYIEFDKLPAILMPFVAYTALGITPMTIDASWGLETIKPGKQYVRCDSLRCCNCGFLFAEQRFTATEMRRLYQGYRGDCYNHNREVFEPGYIERVAKEYPNDPKHIESMEEFIGYTPKRVLDWGGGNGISTPFRGKTDVRIYELDKEVDLLEGVKPFDKTLQYDLIVCNNVLEHVPDPGKLFIDMLMYLSLKGKMFIEIPYDPRIETTDITKRYWHEHINMFTRDSLVYLCAYYGGLPIEKQRVVEVPSGYRLQLLIGEPEFIPVRKEK